MVHKQPAHQGTNKQCDFVLYISGASWSTCNLLWCVCLMALGGLLFSKGDGEVEGRGGKRLGRAEGRETTIRMWYMKEKFLKRKEKIIGSCKSRMMVADSMLHTVSSVYSQGIAGTKMITSSYIPFNKGMNPAHECNIFMVELLFSILPIKHLNGGKISLPKWNHSIRWGDSIRCTLKWCRWGQPLVKEICPEQSTCEVNFEKSERVGLWWEDVLGKRKGCTSVPEEEGKEKRSCGKPELTSRWQWWDRDWHMQNRWLWTSRRLLSKSWERV